MKFSRYIFIVLMILCIRPIYAQEITIESADLEEIFAEHNVTGTFVLEDIQKQQLILVNGTRATKRMYPASTFKIANSLFALEAGAVADENEIIPFGGKPQPVDAWEKDMSMRDAIKVSNVPVYQELARRIGRERYSEYFEKLSYGNGKIGADIEHFWLRGPLKISAIEQVRFLSNLAKQELPFSPQSQLIVRDIMRLETKGNATLFGKTGWTTAPDPDIGWFVGWVEKDEFIYPFAMNIDISSRADADKRVEIALQFLSRLDVY